MTKCNQLEGCQVRVGKISKKIVASIALTVATLGIGLASASSTHAAAEPSKDKMSTQLWFTGEDTSGKEQTLFSTTSDDAAADLNGLINVDKYTNIKEHYSVTNDLSYTLPVWNIMWPPLLNDLQKGFQYGSLVYDTDKGKPIIKYTNLTEPMTEGWSYSTHLKYLPTFRQKTDLIMMYYGHVDEQGHWPADMNPGAKIEMELPLKVAPGYDLSSYRTLLTTSQLVYFTDGRSVRKDANASLHLKITRTLDVADFESDTYATLTNADKFKGINHMFDADGKEQPDKTKADAKITPTDQKGVYDVAYTYDGVTKKVKATVKDQSTIEAGDFTIAHGSNWDTQKFNGIKSLTDANGNKVKSPGNVKITNIKDAAGKDVDKVDTNAAEKTYTITYTNGGASQSVKVTIGKRASAVTPPARNTGSTSSTVKVPGRPVTDNSKASGGNNAGNTQTSTNQQPANNSQPEIQASPGVAKKGAAVYAKKTIYLYKGVNFKKADRLVKYHKAQRVDRPMFVVTGYDRSSKGALRYKVRDVNHTKKSDGKIGYITANMKYVVNVYYQTMPKKNQLTVISKKGVHAYKNVNLTGKTKTYKNGTHLRVKKIVKYHLTTRYQLTNGDYITANKKLVIQGNH